MSEVPGTCTACGSEHRLMPHCPDNEACTWRTCSNPACRTTVDLRHDKHSHPSKESGALCVKRCTERKVT